MRYTKGIDSATHGKWFLQVISWHQEVGLCKQMNCGTILLIICHMQDMGRIRGHIYKINALWPYERMSDKCWNLVNKTRLYFGLCSFKMNRNSCFRCKINIQFSLILFSRWEIISINLFSFLFVVKELNNNGFFGGKIVNNLLA